MSASRSEAKNGKFMARWQLCGSRNRFFLDDSRIYHQISVRLSRCSSAYSIWGWSKTCATFCAPRDLASSNVLDDHGFDSGFMIAMYSFVPMGFQAWIDFIRGMLVIDWCLFHSPRPNHRFAAPCRVRLELVII